MTSNPLALAHLGFAFVAALFAAYGCYLIFFTPRKDKGITWAVVGAILAPLFFAIALDLAERYP